MRRAGAAPADGGFHDRSDGFERRIPWVPIKVKTGRLSRLAPLPTSRRRNSRRWSSANRCPYSALNVLHVFCLRHTFQSFGAHDSTPKSRLCRQRPHGPRRRARPAVLSSRPAQIRYVRERRRVRRGLRVSARILRGGVSAGVSGGVGAVNGGRRRGQGRGGEGERIAAGPAYQCWSQGREAKRATGPF